MADDFPIALNDSAKKRITAMSKEMDIDVYDIIRTLAEEGALSYFRGRSDDPART